MRSGPRRGREQRGSRAERGSERERQPRRRTKTWRVEFAVPVQYAFGREKGLGSLHDYLSSRTVVSDSSLRDAGTGRFTAGAVHV